MFHIERESMETEVMLAAEPSAVKIMREDSSRYKWIEIVNGNMQEVHFGNGQQHMHDASKYSI